MNSAYPFPRPRGFQPHLRIGAVLVQEPLVELERILEQFAADRLHVGHIVERTLAHSREHLIDGFAGLAEVCLGAMRWRWPPRVYCTAVPRGPRAVAGPPPDVRPFPTPAAAWPNLACQRLTTVPSTKLAATTAVVASSVLFRRANLRKRYAADGGQARTCSSFR